MTTVNLRRSAAPSPSSFDREARTVEVVALSGPAPVLRNTDTPDGAPGPWLEELDARFADLSTFIGGPVLKDHVPKVEAQIGVVDDAWIEEDRIIARVRFSTKPEVEGVFEDVAASVLRGVSLGYAVQAWQAMPARDGRPVFRAAQWRPVELSFVPVPADAGAIVRGRDATMSVDLPTPGNRAAVNAEIRSIARVAGMDQTWIDDQIDRAATADQARAVAWDAMSRRMAPDGISTAVVLRDHNDPELIRARMADAVASRFLRTAMPAHGREFADIPIAVLGTHLANQRGARITTRDPTAMVDALLSRAGSHSTSDFPLLLQDAGNKVLQARYAAAAPSYRRWAAERPFRDFKSHKFLHIGDFPALKEIVEAGPVEYGTMSETRETVTAKEYGSAFSIGRKALINDDLQAFADFNAGIAVRVAADENRIVYSLLASNGPTMADGNPLFHSSHGNKANSGTALDVTNFGAAAAAMIEQTSPDGIKLNVAPAILVTGSARLVAAKQLVAQITPAKTSDVNPFAGEVEVVTDANVSGNRWMVFARPDLHPAVVFGYVGGAAGPQIRSEIDFDTRALKIAVGLDFACGVIDFRGAYLNEGA